MTQAGGKSTLALAVFSATMFLSAAAMFSLQPMVGKMLLPLVGGTPAGWAVAMAFFQVMLLGGYLLAHFFSRFTPQMQVLLYIGALALGAPFLPVVLTRAGLPAMPGPVDIFVLLAVGVAIPFIALSATSSTLQRLFMTTGHKTAKDPYFLYAASNLGSFAGLLAYPFFIEPRLPLTLQAADWRVAYLALAACAVLCLLLSGSAKEKKAAESKKPANWARRFEWMLLAFFPSALLVGVTTLISSDVISMPLVWILPLAVYLLTFVAAFARTPPVSPKAAEKALPFALTATLIAFMFQPPVASIGLAALFVHLAAFGAAALFCHTRLASLRPQDGRGLTEFYLMFSIGGALGGIVNVFVAPHLFRRAIEYPILFLALPLLLPGWGARTKNGEFLMALLGLSLLLANFRMPGLDLGAQTAKSLPIAVNLCLAVAAVALTDMRHRALYPLLICFFIVSACLVPGNGLIHMSRNFFGTIKVYEKTDESGLQVRKLMHGTTIHGVQALDARYKTDPHTTYYGVPGPVFDIYKPKKVGVIGLGAGTLNCYAGPSREFTFFEIDPGIISAAMNLFTYLSDCKSRMPPRIIPGDGRLELARLENEKFDLLILDAFSSDTIPTHLLTKEALQLYAGHLSKRGILMLHISNRYFNLSHAIAATAAGENFRTGIIASMHPESRAHPLETGSVWVVAARPGTDLSRLAKYGLKDLPPRPGDKVWTDDYTDILSTLEFTHAKAH